MFSRKYEEKFGENIPMEWQDQVTSVLSESFFDYLKDTKTYFDVFGQIFKDEIIVITSLLHDENDALSPISVFISAEISDNEKQTKKTFDNIIDLTGLIFQDISETKDWHEYIPSWQENEFNNETFFYKITRENISLTIKATQMLNQ